MYPRRRQVRSCSWQQPRHSNCVLTATADAGMRYSTDETGAGGFDTLPAYWQIDKEGILRASSCRLASLERRDDFQTYFRCRAQVDGQISRSSEPIFKADMFFRFTATARQAKGRRPIVQFFLNSLETSIDPGHCRPDGVVSNFHRADPLPLVQLTKSRLRSPSGWTRETAE